LAIQVPQLNPISSLFKKARVAHEGRVGEGFSSGMKIDKILMKKNPKHNHKKNHKKTKQQNTP